MHFVLWGLHQLGTSAEVDWSSPFQCTSCFGVFINSSQTGTPNWVVSFNALRALGSSSTGLAHPEHDWKKFQCTSCFGVFINTHEAHRVRTMLSFNALRALGSSSTGSHRTLQWLKTVSMHFVLWGLHQLCSGDVRSPGDVSMHFVLWGLHQPFFFLKGRCVVTFQCTSCFGVFINPSQPASPTRVMVSMHFVLWGLHQLRSNSATLKLCFL